VTHRVYTAQQQGFTLIELMVALLLGLFLLGGILQIFTHSKKTYRTQTALAELQENGRYAIDFLSKDLRMAGFIGCSSQATLTNTLNTPNDFFYRFDKAIEGFEASSAKAWTPALPSAALPSALTGSDIISLRRVNEQSFTVSAHPSATSAITLDTSVTKTQLKSAGFLNASNTNNCALAAVSNCSSATVFQISNITGNTLGHTTDGSCTPKNSTTDLKTTYVQGQVWPINTVSYYIRKNPANQPALYRKQDTDNAEELIEGIEQMQIVYGVDSDTRPDKTPNYYVTANAVSDWQKVLSIRISLLIVSTQDNLTDNPLSYTYNGTTHSGDRHLRKVFTSTIALRNRLT
jgi:type IV pilus assembly protein PilW